MYLTFLTAVVKDGDESTAQQKVNAVVKWGSRRDVQLKAYHLI